MKKGNRKISKKKMFPDAKRITNADGKRVWLLNSKEYATTQAIINSIFEEELKNKKEVE